MKLKFFTIIKLLYDFGPKNFNLAKLEPEKTIYNSL